MFSKFIISNDLRNILYTEDIRKINSTSVPIDYIEEYENYFSKQYKHPQLKLVISLQYDHKNSKSNNYIKYSYQLISMKSNKQIDYYESEYNSKTSIRNILLAICKAISDLEVPSDITIFTDDRYINSVLSKSDLLYKWSLNNWKKLGSEETVKHADLFNLLYYFTQIHKIHLATYKDKKSSNNIINDTKYDNYKLISPGSRFSNSKSSQIRNQKFANKKKKKKRSQF